MDWILRLKTDEDAALKEIYKQYKPFCLKWAAAEYNLNEADATEIFQISVVILYDNFVKGKLKDYQGDILPYLKAIMRNKYLEFFRQKEKDRKISVENLLMNHIAQNEVEEKEQLESNIKKMIFCIEVLGDPCRSVLRFYYYSAMDMASIAALLGYKNEDSVKTQKYKCLKRLQTMFFSHIEQKLN